MGNSLELDIRSKGTESCVYRGDCIKALKELKNNKYKLISLEDVAKLIIQEGAHSRIANQRFYTREGILSIHEGLYFLKDSYVLEHPKRATKDNKKDRKFEISDKEKTNLLENSVEISEDIKNMLGNNEKANNLLNLMFGSYATSFKNFLNKNEITQMSIKLPEKSKKPYICQIMFLGINKGIHSSEKGLDNSENYWRGIRNYSLGDF